MLSEFQTTSLQRPVAGAETQKAMGIRPMGRQTVKQQPLGVTAMQAGAWGTKSTSLANITPGDLSMTRSISAPKLTSGKVLANRHLYARVKKGDISTIRDLTLLNGANVISFDDRGIPTKNIPDSSEWLNPRQQKKTKQFVEDLPILLAALGEEDKTNCRDWGKAQERQKTYRELASVSGGEQPILAVIRQNPRVLDVPAEQAKNAFAAFAATLGNDVQLILRTISVHPSLLRCSAEKAKDSLPALVEALGGDDEALLAATRCPKVVEMLPFAIRATVQAIADLLGDKVDATWALRQTLIPSKVRVVGRPWTYDHIQGEYHRVLGMRCMNRGVYKRKGQPDDKDVYLYCNIQRNWTMGPDTGWADPAESRGYLEAGRPHAYLTCNIPSVDDVYGVWKCRNAGSYKDEHLLRVEAARKTEASQLICAQPKVLRDSWSRMKDAVGCVWITGPSQRRYQLQGDLKREDKAFNDHRATFRNLGDTDPSKGFQFLRGPFEARNTNADEVELTLIAWAPVLVYLLYYGQLPTPKEIKGWESKIENLNAEASKEKDKARKQELLDEVASLQAKIDSVDGDNLHTARSWIEEEKWRVRNDVTAPRLPALKHCDDIRTKAFPSGPIKIMGHGAGSPPPLVYVTPTFYAESVVSGNQCDVIFTGAPGDIVYDDREDKFRSLGEFLPYKGYAFVRQSHSDMATIQERKQLRLELADRVTAYVVFLTDGPRPNWIQTERWRRRPVQSLPGFDGDLPPCTEVRTKAFDPGEVFIRGSGGIPTLFFLRKDQSGQAPDVAKQVVLKRPDVLLCGDRVQHLAEQLRKHLGDHLARAELMNHQDKWADLVQTSDEKVDAWILSLKRDWLDSTLTETYAKPAYAKCKKILERSVPDLELTYKALLAAVSNSKNGVLKAIQAVPSLMLLLPEAFERVRTDLDSLIPDALRVLSEYPEMFLRPDDLSYCRGEMIRAFGADVMKDRLTKVETSKVITKDEAGRRKHPDETAGGPRASAWSGWRTWVETILAGRDEFHVWLGNLIGQELEGEPGAVRVVAQGSELVRSWDQNYPEPGLDARSPPPSRPPTPEDDKPKKGKKK